jgi:uncharacterized protein YjcR
MVLHQDEKWLRDKYTTEGWSTTDIAKFCGVSHKTICRWLHKHGIPIRDAQSCQLTKSKRIKRENVRRDVLDYIRNNNQTIQSVQGEEPGLKWLDAEGSNGDERVANKRVGDRGIRRSGRVRG